MAYALKFLSGKYQGGEFPLPDDGELIVGRATELDLVLSEDMVSRKHAKLVVHGTSLVITDLGSTNGTFVNGEKVKRAELKLKDRVLIGTSILKVIDAEEMSQRPGSQGEAKDRMQKLGERKRETSTMSGDLTEVPLPDLLQLFATNKKSGVLAVTGDHNGKVFIKGGQLLYAAIGDAPPMPAMKALCRMLMWDTGSFTLDDLDESLKFSDAFTESTESVLIEALRQCDEIRRLLADLPEPSAHIKLCLPMTPKLSALSAAQLDTLQAALNFGNIQDVLDKSDATDHATYTCLQKLLQDGYLEVD